MVGNRTLSDSSLVRQSLGSRAKPTTRVSWISRTLGGFPHRFCHGEVPFRRVLLRGSCGFCRALPESAELSALSALPAIGVAGLIIRRSLVRVQPPPPNFSRTYWQLIRRLEDQFSTTLRTSPSHRLRPWWESECNSYALSGTRLVAKNPLHDQGKTGVEEAAASSEAIAGTEAHWIKAQPTT